MKKTVRDIDVRGRKVIVRCDFNVPMDKDVITDDTRITAALPTIKYLIGEGAAVILMSHMGRPKGKPDMKYTLAPVAARLSELLKQEISFISSPSVVDDKVRAEAAALKPGEVMLLENVRFRKEETDNDPAFAKELASLAEIFVNDAFGTAHRAHASTAGIAAYLPAVSGFLIEKEIKFLGEAVENPDRPLVAIMGGAKVADKIPVIENLLRKVDTLMIGGGMSYTFFKAMGLEIGTSILDVQSVCLAGELIKKAEAAFHVENIADNANMELFHHINQAVKAHGVMKRDVNYVVKDGEVIIVDEFTGRLMIGRRYNEGLHQAIEAKEGVKIADENRTVATITFQNYFRMYKKLAGMTGTALTEAEEFREIYGLEVVTVPTNKPIQRKDLPDSIYKTEAAKFNAVIEQVVECHQKGQPVLVGTVSIEKSEHLSALLKRRGIKHEVLNAKYHEKEAAIVAQAGKFGAVTIATNMAGRGTDITLGGNAEYMAKAAMAKEEFPEELIAEADGHGDTDDEAILAARARYEELYKSFKPGVEAEAEKVRAAGGLFIVGTERHESRRIDNQLRGRAGRQGDPGCSRFFLSMEDDLMRLFGGERMQSMMSSLGVEDDMPIDSKIVSNALESAQKKLEARNFQTRKSVLSFDDVMNTQRQTIYAQRQEILEGKDLSQSLRSMLEETVRAGQCGPLHRGRGSRGLEPGRPAPALSGLADFAHRLPVHHRAAQRPGSHRNQRNAHHPGQPHPGSQGEAVHRSGHAGIRAHLPAAEHRPQLDGPHRRYGPASQGHLPAQLRPEGPRGGVPPGRLRDVRRHGGPHPGRHRAAAAHR